ncbi:MAG: MerR family transcriptional regulator [Terracidiphilus sp.]|jgi:DNA-binding transcriptional MerR regulator
MAMQLPQNRAPESPTIPDRLYFKIGDVARICGVETYVLRFWETQFPQLKPNKSGTGQRLYRRHDVELALKIKQLVHDEGYTISGARQVLGQAHSRKASPPSSTSQSPLLVAPPALQPSTHSRQDAAATIARARAELREIAGLLADPQPQSPPQPPKRRGRLATITPQSGSLFPL